MKKYELNTNHIAIEIYVKQDNWNFIDVLEEAAKELQREVLRVKGCGVTGRNANSDKL